jgi:NAD-dependent DNA ligase
MTGQKIVLTGFRSEPIEEFVERNGGKLSSGVSKNTTLVVYVQSDRGKTKLDKAEELNIPTMTRQEFEKKYHIE